MKQKLEELKIKYKLKIISNDDKIYGNVMTDIIPYDSRYFTLSIIDDLVDEILKDLSKYDIQESVPKRYYLLNQNNSGGYFITDDTLGIGENIIIEARNYQDVLNKLQEFKSKYKGFFKYCSCCGERWYYSEDEFEEAPFEINLDVFHYGSDIIYVHYLDGTINKMKAKGRK